jgi:predicted nucleic acid-binding protein
VSEFVLDNSVTMRWCFDCGSNPYADRILGELEEERAVAFVPPLWRYEVSAVLARAEIKGLLTTRKAEEFIEDLNAFDIRLDEQDADRVLKDVRRLAVLYRLTSYDAAYLELALRKSLPLATLDGELLTACQAAGAAVL